MKKFLSILVVLALMFSLVACKNSKTPTNNAQNNVEQAQEGNNNIENENNTLNGGENTLNQNTPTTTTRYIAPERINQYDLQQPIDFPEDEANNYVWEYTIEDESVVKVVKEDYVPLQVEDGAEVFGGSRIYFFEGLKEGETNVIFKNETGAETVTLHLKVNAEKNLAIISETVEK